MGIETTENTNAPISPVLNPFAPGDKPETVFRTGLAADPGTQDLPCLQDLALSTKPTRKSMAQFEYYDFPTRQEVLTEIRMLDEETNLKALPAALVLVPITVAIVGLSLKSIEEIVPSWISGLAVSLGVSVAAVVILFGIKEHVRKETCLNAWSKALEESQARATKIEDERNKL